MAQYYDVEIQISVLLYTVLFESLPNQSCLVDQLMSLPPSSCWESPQHAVASSFCFLAWLCFHLLIPFLCCCKRFVTCYCFVIFDRHCVICVVVCVTGVAFATMIV